MSPHASTATIERLIVGKAVDHLLKKYASLHVETGEQEPLLNDSTDPHAILAAALSCEDGEVWLFTYEKLCFVKLVIGNGVDVISDYHTALEDTLKPANDLAKALEA